MHRLLDALVSGVHDAKNQLFIAESLMAAAEAKAGVDLGEARYAIEAAANRLSRTLAAYRLLRHGATLAVVPAIVADLCDEVALAHRQHLARAGLLLTVDCAVVDEWPLDRDLVADMLNNAVQNAGRFARHQVHLEARVAGKELVLRVEDDGPGFADLSAGIPATGTGLLVGERLAGLHVRHGRHGRLALANGGRLGGAVFELRLP